MGGDAGDAGHVDQTVAARWPRRLADRLHLRQVLTRDVLVLAALSGLALTQPLLDLFGRNPEFFVAQGIPDGEIVWFALVVTFLVPLVCVGIELLAYAVGAGVGKVVHVALVAILASVLGLSLANQLDAGNALSLVIAVAIGIGVTVATMRVRVVEQLLRYLSASLLLFLVTFLFFSRTGELLRTEEASAAEDVRIGNPAPIVVVQYDEFPIASILNAEGEINAERYPNFARLAASSSWFPNARSVSSATTVSVPATLSGTVPESGSLPISGDFPRTLFTLLGEDYDFVVVEPITDLCPTALCEAEREREVAEEPEPPAPEPDTFGDAMVVLGHRTLPPFLTDDLPSVDSSWGGFLAAAAADDDVIEAEEEAVADAIAAASEEERPTDELGKWKDQGPDVWAPRYQAGILEQQIDAIEATDTPTLWFSHAVFPHRPWHLDPLGREFQRGDTRIEEGIVEREWVDDEYVVRQSLQRHLLQIGYADALLGELIDELEAEGMWEDTLLVVMADHGIAFEPGESPRNSKNGDESLSVPLFIKPPGASAGEIREDPALLIDVFPSVIDLLDIRTGWEFDGSSLFSDESPSSAQAERGDRTATIDGLLAVVERNRAWMPHGDDWPSVAAIGEYGEFVGRPISELDIEGEGNVLWSLDQADELADWRPAESRFVPLLWTGAVITSDGEPPPSEMLAVVNGHVAGVVGGFGLFGGEERYSAVIAGEWLVEGENDVELLVPVDGGTRFRLADGPV